MIELKPGDCLVYRPSNWIGKAIAIKSWLPYSHVEIVVDEKTAIGARPDGCNYYPIRLDEYLAVVMRPYASAFDFELGKKWFELEAKGHPYDVWGLFRFYMIGKGAKDKWFCSELATKFYREANIAGLFHRQEDALVPPGWFVTMADGFAEVWRA